MDPQPMQLSERSTKRSIVQIFGVSKSRCSRLWRWEALEAHAFISEKNTAFFFRGQTIRAKIFISTLKKDVVCSSETLVFLTRLHSVTYQKTYLLTYSMEQSLL